MQTVTATFTHMQKQAITLSLGGLKSVQELAEKRPHGDRIRYMGGCKCVPCRAANSRYETERAAARRRGEWNGIVSAAGAQRHLLRLADRGIGRRTVSDITGIAQSTLQKIKTGEKRNLRAMNEKKILAVGTDLQNDATLISALETNRHIRWLLDEGFTRASIAKRLGYKSPALQFNRQRITVRNARKIERLVNVLRTGE